MNIPEKMKEFVIEHSGFATILNGLHDFGRIFGDFRIMLEL